MSNTFAIDQQEQIPKADFPLDEVTRETASAENPALESNAVQFTAPDPAQTVPSPAVDPAASGPADLDSTIAKRAWDFGLEMWADTYETMKKRLADLADDEILNWCRTSGMADDEAVLKRLWEARKVAANKAEADRLFNTQQAMATSHVMTLESLNERYAILEVEGTASVFVNRKDSFLLADSDLRRRLLNKVVKTTSKDSKPVYKPAYEFWTSHISRHVCNRIAFTSRPVPDDTMNLYRGLGVTPKEGPCDLILNHVREVICAEDDQATEEMLNLLAWQMQHIGEPSRIVVILKSPEEQCGKGFFLARY
jgi:hypothetical protein